MRKVRENSTRRLLLRNWVRSHGLPVSGLVERLELRETSNGSQMYQGQLRDPSGLHYFSVGEYASESMRGVRRSIAR